MRILWVNIGKIISLELDFTWYQNLKIGTVYQYFYFFNEKMNLYQSKEKLVS